MSTFIVQTDSSRTLYPHAVIELEPGAAAQVIDRLRTRSGAMHAARMLNTGACQIMPHLPIGTRVQPLQMSR